MHNNSCERATHSHPVVKVDVTQDWMLASDLDGTLVPPRHAFQPHFDTFLRGLHATIQDHRPLLVYLTGRSLPECLDRFEELHLPLPHFIGADLGSRLYSRNHRVGASYSEVSSFTELVSDFPPGWSRTRFVDACATIELVEYAEEWYQHPARVSFYVRVPDIDQLMLVYEKAFVLLKDICPAAKVIAAYDVEARVGYLDILCSDKGTALSWLKDKYYPDAPETQVVACGDSGGDIEMLTAGSLSVLVGNADPYVKRKVQAHFETSGKVHQLFTPEVGYDHPRLGDGQYISGVLQGLDHFGVDVESKLT